MSIRLTSLIEGGFAEQTQIFRIQSRIQRLQTLVAIEKEKLQRARAVLQRKRELEKNRQQHQK